MTHLSILFLEKYSFNLFYLFVSSIHPRDLPWAGEAFPTLTLLQSTVISSKLPYLPMFFMRILASGGISSGSLCRDKGGQSGAGACVWANAWQGQGCTTAPQEGKGTLGTRSPHTVTQQNTNSFVHPYVRRSSSMTTKYLTNQTQLSFAYP